MSEPAEKVHLQGVQFWEEKSSAVPHEDGSLKKRHLHMSDVWRNRG
jgi:hypothetical protein